MIREKNKNKGVALLIVLFVIMVVTVLAVGFLSRSDVELACGENMAIRTAMDYLAESGLQQAKGLILNPQDANSDAEYWTGDTRQRLVSGSSDYYDVSVNKLGPCNYQITTEAYRLKGTEKVGKSGLIAELRLDPCVALWVGISWNSEFETFVNGDVYCNGNLSGSSNIHGDVFATGDITASNVTGSRNSHFAQRPVALPGVSTSDFSSSYYVGTSNYSVQIISEPNLPAGSYYASTGNPAGVYYCNGDADISSGININGMLVVNGNLKIKGANNVITAVKNFPALLVGGELIMEDGATLTVNGLVQVGDRIFIKNSAANVHITVNGALLIPNGDIDGLASSTGSTLAVTAVPNAAAIQVWSGSGTPVRWSPAAEAFFRSIKRQ